MSKMIQGKAVLVTVTAIQGIQRQVFRDMLEKPPLSTETGGGRQGSYRKEICLSPCDRKTTCFRKNSDVLRDRPGNRKDDVSHSFEPAQRLLSGRQCVDSASKIRPGQ
jgi:hypothetical protein